MTSVPVLGMRRRRGAAAGLLALLGTAALLAVTSAAPASAELKLPLLPPLPLPSLNPDDALDLSKTVSGVTNLLDDTTTDVVGNTGVTNPGPGQSPDPQPAASPATHRPTSGRSTAVDSWSVERAARGGSAGAGAATSPSRPGGSYTSLVSGGLRAAAGRAVALAGPLAAPVAVALFAVGLLVFAAKGPTRLVKVEQDRQAFRDRRTYRL